MNIPKTNGKLSRRKFLVLGGATAAAAGLAACGPATPAKVTGKVSFLAWGDSADLPAWEKLAAAYKVKNPDVIVDITPVAEPNNNFYTKLQTSIAGGAAPDVASFQGWEWQTYAAKGVLVDIGDMVKRDSLNAFADNDGVKLSTRYKDKLHMVPQTLASMLMFYSKKVFDDAGVKYPTDDWTYSEFVELSKKLTNNKSGPDKRYGVQANGGWFRDIHWIRGTGKREFDNIVDPKKSQFNQPEIAAIVQQVASDWYNKDRIAPTAADTSGGANQIQTGNVAMKYEGPWWFTTMNSQKLQDEKKNHPFDVVLMPKQQDGTRPHRAWADGVAMLKGKNESAAWDFVKYLGGEEGDKIYCEITGRMPNNVKLITEWWMPLVDKNFGVKNSKAFMTAFSNGQLDVTGLVPRSKIWAEVVKPTAWDKLIAGTATASQVLAEVDTKVQKLLDEAK